MTRPEQEFKGPEGPSGSARTIICLAKTMKSSTCNYLDFGRGLAFSQDTGSIAFQRLVKADIFAFGPIGYGDVTSDGEKNAGESAGEELCICRNQKAQQREVLPVANVSPLI